MALDGAFLYCLKQELAAALSGARIDKIHQPTRDELMVSMRQHTGVKKLYISARSNSPRVHFTGIEFDNPPSPPMFCMLLRKHLTGARLKDIRQPGLERALYFDFDCINELGDKVKLTLAVEIMGRHSNIILVDSDGIVIDSIKRVDLEKSSVRPVLPGLKYSPPPIKAGKLDLTLCKPDDIINAAMSGKEPLSKALLSASHGLSPLICREVAHRATRGLDTTVNAMVEEEWHRATFYLMRIKAAVETGENRRPYILYDKQGVPLEYSFIPIVQYGFSAVGKEMDSFSALLDAFYAQKDAAFRSKQRAQDILRVLTNVYERTTRRIENQKHELEQSFDRDQYRIYGDLINANIGIIPKGAKSAELINYYDSQCATIKVPLDPSLSPAQNAQKYYKEYRKAQTAEQMLTDLIEQGEQELKYIDTVFDALSRASTLRELDELRDELASSGYMRAARRPKKSARLAPLKFLSDDGFTILVGRNNIQNDTLTLRTARGHDIWFHTKNIPGSHVVIITDGKNPPDRTLEQAAMLAALYSKAAGSQQVPVDYTEVRNVKKPKGAKPGMVIYKANRTAYVTPDAALAERLQK